MKVDLFKVIQHYMYGIAQFTQDVNVQSPTQEIIYKKDQVIRIGPTLIWMLADGKIPVNAIKPVLRQLHQITDKEMRELANLGLGDNSVKNLTPVKRGGIAKAYTIEVITSKEISFAINNTYDVSIVEKVIIPNAQPIITLTASKNQPAVMAWLLDKQFDVFKLIPQGFGYGRANWSEDYYEKA